MKTIEWNLPFKNMDYLRAMSNELVQNSAVLLVTGIQDKEGNIGSCSITMRETANIEQDIFYVGAIIGAHSVSYALQKKEPVDNTEDIVEEETTTGIEKISKHEVGFRKFLREILNRFKKF